VPSDATEPMTAPPTHAATSLWQPAFVVVTGLQFVTVLTNGSTTMALPSIQDGLGASNAELQWFASLFALAFSLVLVMGGRLGDLYGTRRLLLLGNAGFVAAIALQALAPTIGVLLAARVVQGLAGGLMAPQLSAVIQRTFTGHTRTRAFTVYLTAAGASFSLGQLVGGGLMAADPLGLGWRWGFLPFVVPGVVLWFVARRTIADFEPEAEGRLDVPGAVGLAAVAFLLMFPLIQGRVAGWPVWIIVLLAAAVPVFGAFVAHERRLLRRGDSPLVNPGLFAIPTFRAGNLVTLLVGLIAGAVPLFLILTVQIGFGRNAFAAALLSFPMPLANMAGSLVTAPLLRRFGRLTVVMGAVCTALAAVAVLVAVRAGAGSVSVVALLPGFMLIGLALGIALAAVLAIALSDVPAADAGSAAGVQATGLQLSSAVGIAVYGVAFYGIIGTSTRLQPYLDGLSAAMVITIGLAAVQALLVLGLPRHRRDRAYPAPSAPPVTP
jgi:MFS family permease